ncbi:P1 family peptidase [Sphingomonas aracearum]|uniref:Peptidase S58 family protein n=1 Tax=Sphingomonas aracearum TaxID=2283317 RepID=A0A369VTA6_9SPHN|nr:P1 family peptidase [Sphingomonas aracearum]RDE05273.1 peptidase S58 family protein [Sphingomonas aracearum]
MSPRPGPRNLLTDVPGLTVGHATDERVGTGVTVLRCAHPFVAAVDVRGGGPGVRETETLAPENLVPGVHAIVLTGGSVFGLAAADAVTARLSVQGTGLQLRPGSKHIPIVPAAVLHDLMNPGDKDWGEAPPYRALGVQALDAAAEQFALGAVGAGRGAQAGTAKGGIGSASLDLGDGIVVGALAAVNSIGSTLMPDGETFWAWPFERDDEFGGHRPGAVMPDLDPLADLGRLMPGAATTLAVVACNAALTKAEAKRVAIMAQDGMARAIRPIHTPFDGDLVFSLASGAVPLGERLPREVDVARIGTVAADCLARAIARGVFEAR